MFIRALLSTAVAALLLLCCACSSTVYAPSHEVVYTPRQPSAIVQPSLTTMAVNIQVEAPADPRLAGPSGNLFYPTPDLQRTYEYWLKSGIRIDSRMDEFIAFSGAKSYTWWQGGGGLVLNIADNSDLVRLALRWGKFFPDVVKELYTPAGVSSRSVSGLPLDPATCPPSYGSYVPPLTNGYNNYSYNNCNSNNGYSGNYNGGYNSGSSNCNNPWQSAPPVCAYPAPRPVKPVLPKAGIDSPSGPFSQAPAPVKTASPVRGAAVK